MMHGGIIQAEHRVLREKAREVSKDLIGSTQLKDIVARMKKALAGQYDGVAIAAPQIGEQLRLFVVSKIFWEDVVGHADDDKVFINPVVTKRSKRTSWMEEGCLSVRFKYGEVKRSTTATIRALDEHGRIFTHTGHGLLAQVFQHETDHLDGVLFIDSARNIHDIDPDAIEEIQKHKTA